MQTKEGWQGGRHARGPTLHPGSLRKLSPWTEVLLCSCHPAQRVGVQGIFQEFRDTLLVLLP